jgi:hypothetical protein
MRRVIVEYAKLTNEILNLLVDKFPDGYDDEDIIRFRNAKNELIEAVEVRTEDTMYLVSTKLADRIENYDEDDEIDDVIEPIIPTKGLDIDEDMDDDDDDDNLDKPETDDDDDDDDDDSDDSNFSDDEDDDDED